MADSRSENTKDVFSDLESILDDSLFIFKKKFLAMPFGMHDLSSPSTDRTWVPCSGNAVLTTGPPGKSQVIHSIKRDLKYLEFHSKGKRKTIDETVCAV